MNEYTRYIPLKSAIESVLGSDAWYALKESNHLPTWKRYLTRVMGALHISILATVEVHDDDWLIHVNETFKKGKSDMKSSKDIELAIAAFSATLVKISFLQVGLIPQRKGFRGSVPLTHKNWRLRNFRTVMYVQSAEQKEALFWSTQQKNLGIPAQRLLWDEFRKSKSQLPYSAWCAQKT